jgi:glutathione S-transferase
MMPIQTLTLWGHWGAPNPFKVCIVLEALGLPYETHLLELSEVKRESYVKLNPNGRLPTLQDPNTGLDLFEVSALAMQKPELLRRR